MIDWSFIAGNFPQVFGAVPVTLGLVFASVPFGWALGLLIALVRRAHVPVLSQVAAVFVSFMRSVPMVVILFISYFAMPIIVGGYLTSIGLSVDLDSIPPVAYAIAAFVLDQAAYSSEALRSAIAAIDRGQLEAARSVGMTTFQAYVRIVMPQALVSALPNLNGLFVGLLQGSSLAYFVGVYEVTATTTLLANSSYSYIEAYLMATVVYELLSFAFNRAFRVIERKASRFQNAGDAPEATAGIAAAVAS